MAVLQVKETNPASGRIVPHVTNILQNIWLTLIYNGKYNKGDFILLELSRDDGHNEGNMNCINRKYMTSWIHFMIG